jgi:hypothetical protein
LAAGKAGGVNLPFSGKVCIRSGVTGGQLVARISHTAPISRA